MCSEPDTFVQTLKNIKMKKVIIIGATSGIGKGLAERFLREGNTVGITGRREDKLQEICSQNKNCFYSVSDVTKDTDTVRQLSNLVNRVGGMDILVFCSGIGELNPELDYLLEKPTLLTNVIGFTNVVDWAFHFFQKQEWGHLIVISSVGGMRGEGIAPAYNASKAYQINYTEGLRKKQPSYLILFISLMYVPDLSIRQWQKGRGCFGLLRWIKLYNRFIAPSFEEEKLRMFRRDGNT